MAFSYRRSNGSVCLVRDGAFDGRPRTLPLPKEACQEELALTDQFGHRYVGAFDGREVRLTRAHSRRSARYADWVLGTEPVRIPGAAPLDVRFLFTFFDHGRGGHRLNALWSFTGTRGQAVVAFHAAGFERSRLEERGSGGRIHVRTQGKRWTGADSAHAIIYPSGEGEMATGEIHVGEHNPLRGWGVGFLLHQWEIRSRG